MKDRFESILDVLCPPGEHDWEWIRLYATYWHCKKCDLTIMAGRRNIPGRMR